ncbi:DUF5320 domain-containing protein [Candidatus Woesearchaeota archaeon]|nr:DUF5320 domain-containing protein [Candidatus Woesearchaeota archaeon]
MPGYDRTGPRGEGPMTGRGAGYCGPAGRGVNVPRGAGRGFPPYGGGGGRAFGGGRGFGFGFGRVYDGSTPVETRQEAGADSNLESLVKSLGEAVESAKEVLATTKEMMDEYRKSKQGPGE